MITPVLVSSVEAVRPDWPQAERRRRPSESGPLRWVVAAVVGILAAATLAVGENGGLHLRSAEERLIQTYLDAWYGGDFDAAQGLRAFERLRTGPSEARARDEVEYQALLGAQTGIEACDMLPPSTVRCDVTYSSALSEAVGAKPVLVSQQFGIADGLILFVAGPYLEDTALMASFRDFASERFPEEYEDACVDEPNLQPPECARFKLRHLDEWVGWRDGS